jgi:hypothetical protein
MSKAEKRGSKQSTTGKWIVRDDTHPSVVLPPPPDRLLALVDKWAADDSGYEESTWPELRKALEEDRLSDRPLFVE